MASKQEEFLDAFLKETEPTEQDLDQFLAETGGDSAPAPAAAPAPDPGKSNLFPTASQVEGSGLGATAKRVSLGALDLMGVPTRAGGALRGMEMSDPDAYLLRPEVEAMKLDTTGEGGRGIAMMEAAARSGAPMSAPITPSMINAAVDFGGRVLSDPMSYLPGIGPLIKGGAKMARGAGKGARLANKGAGRLAEEMSGVSQEALRKAGTKEGRTALEAAAGKEGEIGEEFLSYVENAEDYMPEKARVEAALDRMGPINLGSAEEAMQSAKGPAVAGRLSPSKKAGNDAVQTYIDFLRGKDLPEDLPNQTVTAREYRDLRRDLDAQVDWKAEGAEIKNRGLKAGRNTMKNELLRRAEESGIPEYAEDMKSWSNKLDKLEKIKELIGKTGNVRDRRVEQFINNLFGKNSRSKQRLMRDLDEIFGQQFTQQAKDAQLASQLGEGGQAGWLPRQFSGRALLGYGVSSMTGTPLAAPLLASPKIASRFTLPALTKMEEGLQAAGVALTPKAKRVSAALKKPASEAQKARLASILASEIESEIRKQGAASE